MVRHAHRGVTLVELLVVLGVIAVLSMAFVLRMAAARQTATEDAAKATASSLAAAVSSYYMANACYPRDVPTGVVPTGMGPYVGGQWPAEFDYEGWSSYIGISWRPNGSYRWTVWVSAGVPVALCP